MFPMGRELRTFLSLERSFVEMEKSSFAARHLKGGLLPRILLNNLRLFD
jgi:hypothetical protein